MFSSVTLGVSPRSRPSLCEYPYSSISCSLRKSYVRSVMLNSFGVLSVNPHSFELSLKSLSMVGPTSVAALLMLSPYKTELSTISSFRDIKVLKNEARGALDAARMHT